MRWPNFKFFWGREQQLINSTICVWTRVRTPLFSSSTNSLLLSSWATWDNRKVVWKDVYFSAKFSWTSLLSDHKVPNGDVEQDSWHHTAFPLSSLHLETVVVVSFCTSEIVVKALDEKDNLDNLEYATKAVPVYAVKSWCRTVSAVPCTARWWWWHQLLLFVVACSGLHWCVLPSQCLSLLLMLAIIPDCL